MQHTRTYILVADAGHARTLLSTGPKSKLEFVADMKREQVLPRTHDLTTERLQRTHDSAGGQRHAVEAHSDPHRELKSHFAAELVKLLDAKRAEGAFDRLVLVAPPAFLGDLRAAMTPALEAVVHGEVAKDLAKAPNDEVRDHLGDVVPDDL